VSFKLAVSDGCRVEQRREATKFPPPFLRSASRFCFGDINQRRSNTLKVKAS
jgi:hypothetical protein